MENINETEINYEYFIQKIIDKTNIPENDVRAILDEMRNVFQGKSQIM